MSDSSYTGSINNLLGFDSDYNNKLIVQEGNLVYVSDEVSSQEVKWLEKLGIEKASDYFTVEFDSAGGTEINSQSIRTGNLVKKPSNPIKSGHDFLGWYYLKESGSEDNPTYTEIEFDFNTQITNNYSLYAKYSGEAVMMARDDNYAFWQEEYRTNITSITLKKSEIPTNLPELNWDMRDNNTTSEIRAYLENIGNGTYTLTIISPLTIYANINAKAYFNGFTNLTSIDFSNFDTSQIMNMSQFFYDCINLEELLHLDTFDTSKVKIINRVFANCSNLKTLDLSNFDTSNVRRLQSTFSGCTELTTLKLNGWDTSNVTTMQMTFYKCNNLTSLNLSSFKTEKVKNMFLMFYQCTNLTSLDLSNFNTSNVTNMERMFAYCTNLVSLNISHFDTSSVSNMCGMFKYCRKLEKLDLSSFNFSSVNNYEDMLIGIDCNVYTKNTISAEFVYNIKPSLNIYYGSEPNWTKYTV